MATCLLHKLYPKAGSGENLANDHRQGGAPCCTTCTGVFLWRFHGDSPTKMISYKCVDVQFILKTWFNKERFSADFGSFSRLFLPCRNLALSTLEDWTGPTSLLATTAHCQKCWEHCQGLDQPFSSETYRKKGSRQNKAHVLGFCLRDSLKARHARKFCTRVSRKS